MKSTKTDSTSRLDKLKWMVIVALLTTGIAANYLYIQQPWPIRVAAGIVLSGFLVAIALNTQQGHRFWEFAREAYGELRRVVWPTRQETVQTTFIVVVMIIMMSLMLWGLDAGLLWAVGVLTGQR